MIWLGQQTQIEKRSRRWTAIALTASIAATLLQLLLVTGVLPFCHPGRPGRRVRHAAALLGGDYQLRGTTPSCAFQLNRSPRAFSDVGVPVGVAAFAVGIGISAMQGEGSWAWVVGGLPGALAWLAFPLWVLLVARDAAWGPHR